MVVISRILLSVTWIVAGIPSINFVSVLSKKQRLVDVHLRLYTVPSSRWFLLTFWNDYVPSTRIKVLTDNWNWIESRKKTARTKVQKKQRVQRQKRRVFSFIHSMVSSVTGSDHIYPPQGRFSITDYWHSAHYDK